MNLYQTLCASPSNDGFNCPDLCKRVREHDEASWTFVEYALVENFRYVQVRQSRRKLLKTSKKLSPTPEAQIRLAYYSYSKNTSRQNCLFIRFPNCFLLPLIMTFNPDLLKWQNVLPDLQNRWRLSMSPPKYHGVKGYTLRDRLLNLSFPLVMLDMPLFSLLCGMLGSVLWP